ncbi:TetR/AcrR family transcriptional regulator C-terminal domain-containing protein [Vagococcus intermedius]|uniref:TetR/AcrR family transcriptional regulator C-terminal domain-containing protein n=1 Tax=Vagococcus intermedius TaxID=2991418 RepID=A0AAF0CWF1_9ENTE|nr:TetR/AcrR family transcriptional regulator C-terminal domain-containing protein [Vagococcus intermedius]WEG74082.1 TetR/AcrR family transcriptional regulator C-terminal domain-containing protein [Vagococcus intermedius]WEG76162.1 TetR/AcrR family transcriptional regulator C-terminal domain-containing protein [Vagococcus intermedius]
MATSLDTKNKIIKTFGQLATEQKVEKINIKEITEFCECNRQTFYYHFSCKSDLLSYFFQIETFGCLSKTQITQENWIGIVSEFLLKISTNKEMYYNILNFDREVFQKNFYEAFKSFFTKYFSGNRTAYNNEISYAEFLSYGFCGIVMDWILTKCKESLELMIVNVVSLVRSIEIK